MNRNDVVREWVRSGIIDFYLYFELDEKWYHYNAFFLHQGLEKLCKAYLLGERASEYEGLRNEKVVRRKVEDMAKQMGHDLNSMLKVMKRKNLITKENFKLGKEPRPNAIKVLLHGYEQCRYPLPVEPVHTKYPVKGKAGFYNDILASSNLRKAVYPIARQILERIQSDFSIDIPKRKATYNNKIDDKQWERFCRLFFETN